MTTILDHAATVPTLDELVTASKQHEANRLRELKEAAKPILSRVRSQETRIANRLPEWRRQLAVQADRYQQVRSLLPGLHDLTVEYIIREVGGGDLVRGVLPLLPGQVQDLRDTIERAGLAQLSRPQCLSEWTAQADNIDDLMRAVADRLDQLTHYLRDGGPISQAAVNAIETR